MLHGQAFTSEGCHAISPFLPGASHVSLISHFDSDADLQRLTCSWWPCHLEQPLLEATAYPSIRPNVLTAYICGTLTAANELTHDSMSKHDPNGHTLCIHSMCVAAESQRKGIATRMLKVYLQYVQQSCPQAQTVQLICKERLIRLYESAGFVLIGPSSIVHGQDQWFSMQACFDPVEDP